MLWILLNISKGRHALGFQDLISAIMVVDASSAMIGMTLSGKETLAARLLIIVIGLVQILTLVTFLVAINHIPTLMPAMPTSSCSPRVFWWGTIEAGKALPVSFWLYFCLKSVSSLHSVWLTWGFSSLFNVIAKASRGHRVKANTHTSNDQPGVTSSNIGIERAVPQHSYDELLATV